MAEPDEPTYADLAGIVRLRHFIRHHDEELNEIVERLEVDDLDYGELRDLVVALAEAQRITRLDVADILNAVETLCQQAGIWPLPLIERMARGEDEEE